MFDVRPDITRIGSWVAFALATSGPFVSPLHAAPQRPADDRDLTVIEQDQARRLSMDGVREHRLLLSRPVIIGRIELLREKGDDGETVTDRHALVTMYRYEGDLGIVAAVNLTKGAVVSVDTVPGLSVPLATEEFDHARKLALADSGVSKVLGKQAGEIVVEPLVLRTTDRSDSLYAHRVVRLLFRLGRDYLTDPIVLVDLTDDRVLLEHPRR